MIGLLLLAISPQAGGRTVALINPVPPEKADGMLAELYQATEEFFGRVPNNVQLMGVTPEILANQIDFAAYYAEHPTLSFQFLGMCRALIAHRSGSPYCAHLNEGLLQQRGITSEQWSAIKADPGSAPLSTPEKALLLFVVMATEDPHEVKGHELDELRSLGWTDKDIFDAVAHGARAAYANLIFDVFKLEQD
jgi:alkylhydroperoxidase family enzyme